MAPGEKVRIPDIGASKEVQVTEVYVREGESVKFEDPLVSSASGTEPEIVVTVVTPSDDIIETHVIKVGDTISEDKFILSLRPEPEPSTERQREAGAGLPSTLAAPDYKPAPAMIALVRQGFEVAVARDRSVLAEGLGRLTDKHLGDFIMTRLRRMFSVLADQFAERGDFFPQLGEQYRFNEDVAALITERLPASPESAELLCRQLFVDLATQIQAGRRFEGAWGQLARDGDALFMRIDGPHT
ncbi:MAG TPA: hypothetical protein VF744_13005 [Beijerinckiaceae bacterium]|jgi:pyruvate/2-oxoglutarate dehydrogenase complex dihydrolipoamide acyltransferase (E2) component